MMFTRSVDETGATIAVVKELRTAPVLLVDWVNLLNQGKITSLDMGLGCGFLVIFSFIILLILRFIARGRR